VRMVHRGRRPRLPGEALAEQRIFGHRGSHDLQRHQPAQALLSRRAQAAMPDMSLEFEQQLTRELGGIVACNITNV
jgi:hypothetical protein